MSLRRETVAITTLGSAGSATASADTRENVNGTIVAIYVDYDASAPATVDVTIVEATNVPALPVLTETNVNTDGWFFPDEQAVNALGVAITGQGQSLQANDRLNITIAQANAGQIFKVTVVWNTDSLQD
jgi:hypothetical protein